MAALVNRARAMNARESRVAKMVMGNRERGEKRGMTKMMPWLINRLVGRRETRAVPEIPKLVPPA